MKAVLVQCAAIAAALVVGVQLAAQQAPSAGDECPWVSKQAAAATQRPPAQVAADAQADEESVESEPFLPHPLKAADCAAGGWRVFTTPGFDSQEACEGWVLETLRPRMLQMLPPGQSREFDFTQRENGGGANLRSGAPLLI